MWPWVLKISEREWNFNVKLDTLVREKFGPGYPSMTELEQRTAIALVNTNPSFNIPMPLPENVIPVGGLHIRDTKPLPEVRNAQFEIVLL